MFVVTNRVPVKESFELSFESRFRGRISYLENQPGFVDFKLMRPITRTLNRETGQLERLQQQGVYLVQTIWETEEDFWNWTRSEAFREAHEDVPPDEVFAGPSTMEMHEVLISDGHFKYENPSLATEFDDGE